MLGKIFTPRTKAELLKAIHATSFRSFYVLKGVGSANCLPEPI